MTQCNQCVQTIDLQEFCSSQLIQQNQQESVKAHLIFFNAMFDHQKTEPLRQPQNKYLYRKKHSQPNEIYSENQSQLQPQSSRIAQFSPFKGELRQKSELNCQNIELKQKHRQPIVHQKQKYGRQLLFQAKDQSSLIDILRKGKQSSSQNQQQMYKLPMSHNVPISTQFQNKIVKQILEQKQQQKKEQKKESEQLEQKIHFVFSFSPKKIRRASVQYRAPLTERKFSIKGNQIRSNQNSPLLTRRKH